MPPRPHLAKSIAALLLLLLAAIPARAFERTEQREPCAGHDPLRNAYFGDLHVHTTLSLDASALGVRLRPRDAYRFARGEEMGIRPYDASGNALRRVRLERPLDFTAVTDHAELLGETEMCTTPGSAGFDSLLCNLYRRWPLLAYYFVNSRMLNVAAPLRYSFCGADGARCRAAAAGPWKEIQVAAEGAYDRSSACGFTSFVAYEWSGNPESNMLHRNVIFRNAVVPSYPTSYVDDPRPEGLWGKLHSDCLDAGRGCDVLAIPHNSNLSGGWLFRTETSAGPLTRAGAIDRAALEPLVEILQHKGDSECRLAATTPDELCGFEKLPFARMDQQHFPSSWSEPPPLSFVREALAEGLLQQAKVGANPFKLGIIAASDTHQGTPGLVSEKDFPGHAAGGDTAALEIPKMPDAVEFNPGGLSVLWAEENSRDSLFEAMRRREAYGTSGPRMVVRFFAGWSFAEGLCRDPDFVERGYRDGVPMGGDLAARPPGATAPTFALSALKDPGPGAPLQRLQIIKIWLEGGGARQRVHDVAGNPDNGASVDLGSCAYKGEGFDDLCTVWRDPDFDASAPALYYARVVENPSCRWTTWTCNANRVDCARPASIASELAFCCDASYPRTIQERAWTSPIWYTPASSQESAFPSERNSSHR